MPLLVKITSIFILSQGLRNGVMYAFGVLHPAFLSLDRQLRGCNSGESNIPPLICLFPRTHRALLCHPGERAFASDVWSADCVPVGG